MPLGWSSVLSLPLLKSPNNNIITTAAIMLFESLVVLATASLSLAMTPQGFTPSTQTPLMVSYNGIDGSLGKVIAKEGERRNPPCPAVVAGRWLLT